MVCRPCTGGGATSAPRYARQPLAKPESGMQDVYTVTCPDGSTAEHRGGPAARTAAAIAAAQCGGVLKHRREKKQPKGRQSQS